MAPKRFRKIYGSGLNGPEGSLSLTSCSLTPISSSVDGHVKSRSGSLSLSLSLVPNILYTAYFVPRLYQYLLRSHLLSLCKLSSLFFLAFLLHQEPSVSLGLPFLSLPYGCTGSTTSSSSITPDQLSLTTISSSPPTFSLLISHCLPVSPSSLSQAGPTRRYSTVSYMGQSIYLFLLSPGYAAGVTGYRAVRGLCGCEDGRVDGEGILTPDD